MCCSVFLGRNTFIFFSVPEIPVFGKGCTLMLQWAEHFKFLAGLYREFEVHWWALSVDKLKKIAELCCLETSVSLVSAERGGNAQPL